MKISNIHILVLSVLTSILCGCSDEWLEEKPPHLITSGTVYTNLTGFEAGLNGLYALVRQERSGSGDGEANYLRSEMLLNGTDNMAQNLSDAWSLIAENWAQNNRPEHGYYSAHFSWLYRVVNSANTIIEQAETQEDIDWTGGNSNPEDNKARVVAEARAIRAWAYRHLTFGWGDVPLSLTESKGSTVRMDWERTSVAEVRNQMKSDWEFAEKHLNVEPATPGKITRGAVQHYLAELYLTLGKPDSALYWADKCISTPAYKLVTQRYGVKAGEPGVPFMDMFYDGNVLRSQGNTESLWSWEYEFGVNGGGRSIVRRWGVSRYDLITVNGIRPFAITAERGGRGIFRMSMTKYALDVYEPQDDRFSGYAIRKYFVLRDAAHNAPAAADVLPPGYSYGDTVKLDWSQDITPQYSKSNYTWPFSRKIEGGRAADPLDAFQYNDQVYLRLADTYLLKAEAQFLMGNISDAAETINIIRTRSNATPVTAGRIDMDFILDERSRELFTEEHRRYTLLRTGTWLSRVRKYNHNGGSTASERDQLFPIPQSVIDANLNKPMQQNQGY